MVNTSLKELKRHLAGFDKVVKERTTAITITEGTWGFEHTKACFRDEIIPFIKELKDIFNNFNQYLVDELADVQNVFYQMEQAVEQHRLESRTFEVKMNQVLSENVRSLDQAIDHDIVKTVVNLSVNDGCETVNECQKCLELKTELLNKKDVVDKETYDKLCKSFTTLEKYCITLEADSQLNQEIFQQDPTVVTKLIAENEHLKQTYKQLYDSIKPARIRSKEQCDDLINQVNIKSVEISDLNASLQEKALAITTLKDELSKLKGKALVDNNVSNHPSDPELHQVHVEPITPKLLNKRIAYFAYIKHSQEEAAVLRDLVDHIKANYPLDPLLESACKYTKLIQEMLSKISKTCPSINSSGEQLVAMTPMNKVKSVRFTKPVTSSRNTKTAHTSNLVSNKPMLSSTGVKQSTSASGSQPSGNTKKDKIQQTQSRILKNKVEAHPRKVKSSLKNKDHVVEPKGTAPVQHSKLNANSDLKCVKCNGCMLSDNHDLCVLDFINNVNARAKSRSVKKNSKRKVWKPTGKVFTNIGYIWRPTGRTFTIVGNACPLTRITTTTEVPLRKSSALDNKTPKPVVTLVYSRKPRKSKTSVPVNNYKVIKSVTANNSEPSQSRGSIVSNVPSSSLDECRHGLVRGLPKLKFEKDHLCSACALGKSTKKPYKPKSKDTNQEKLYLLHMDLCGPMRVASVNGKKYILVIVDDYSRFTWYDLRKPSDASEQIMELSLLIRHCVNIMRRLASLMNIFSPALHKQNGVVEDEIVRELNQSLTMLIYAKAPLFILAEAVATACYTQNHSMIRLQHGKTPYELLHNKPPDLFSGPALYKMTLATISSRLMPNPHLSTPFVPLSRTDWDILFQQLFDEFLNPSPSVDHLAPEVVIPINEAIALVLADSTGSPSSTTVDQDAPSPSNSQTTPETEPPIIPNDVKEDNHEIRECTYDQFPLGCNYMSKLFSVYNDASSLLLTKTFKDALTQPDGLKAMQENLMIFDT
ncbi:retrovirus-related pol polyprotein from transposon TNT 1-94 [Tanacetum coccineum]